MLLFALWLTACDSGKPDATIADADGDGAPAEHDCDDGDAAIHPGAAEICDGHDQDCDGEVDEGVLATFWTDGDGDGHGAGANTRIGCAEPGWAPTDDDCDDADPAVFPGAVEACNGVDDDCDGVAETDVGEWYTDADGDGYGDPATRVETCTPDPAQVSEGTDCDDTDPAVFPGAEELCDLDDDDCDGRADAGEVVRWYADVDGDGYGHRSFVTESCAPPEGYVLDATDCGPGDSAVHPGAAERCNDVDDDCDGERDEDFDADGDGDASAACGGGTDCDDTDADVFTGASEVCGNGVDDDCDGRDANCGYDGDFDLGADATKLWSGTSNYDAGRLMEIADLTGDGVNDLVLATRYAESYSGGAYVIPGPITAGGTFSSTGFRIRGTSSTYSAGRSMGIGDVDGDGFQDFAIGAPDGTTKEWILLGPVTGDTTVPAAEIVYYGESYTETGHGSDVADVDGDGIDDAVIGAYEDAEGGYQAGAIFVDYGPLAAGTYNVDAVYDAKLIGEYVSAYAGRYVRAGADVDGDGMGDILACAPYASVSGPYSGTGYVVYGGVTGDMSLADADGHLHGEAPNDYAGEELTMGDLDGDGLADVVMGAYDTRNRNAGVAYVVYGPAAGTRDLSDADIVLRGDEPEQYVGLGLAVADVDGDGRGELLVGGIGDRDGGGRDAGAAWLFFGPGAGTLTLDDAAARFLGEDAGDQAGESVAFGDVDGDGVLEVLVGAPGEATGGSAAGAAYVVFAAH